MGSSGGQDGVVGLAGATDLHVAEAALVEQACVLGGRPLAALGLDQHVEGEELSHDGAAPVLQQQRLHQQDPSTCTHTPHTPGPVCRGSPSCSGSLTQSKNRHF